jgi:TATA-binding protein-associated factor Taf7
MKISKKVKIALRSLLMKCGAIATDKATLLFEGAEPEVGMEVFVEDENGEILPAPDGEYEAEGVVYVIAEGKIAEIRRNEEGEPAEETPAEEPAEEPVEGEEEEPQADPVDEPEETETETVEDRVARLEESIGELREGIESILEAIAALVQRVEVV